MTRALLGTALALVLPLVIAGCKADKSRARNNPAAQKMLLGSRPSPRFAPTGKVVLHERSGSGRIAYLGMDIDPETPVPGATAELTHYFEVLDPALNDYDVFVHGEVPNEGRRALVADHAPLSGLVPTSQWKKGDLWADRHRVLIPEDISSGTFELYAGLFKGEQRLTVEAAPGINDGSDRIRVATLKLGGGARPDGLPEVTVVRTSTAIVPDGVLDEEVWKKAEVMTFSDSMGRGGAPRFGTKLRLLYDDTNLYVAFESVDEDVSERYQHRDDPIYDHETVEVFLMPNVIAPALGPYVELQASPGGIIFDAAFTARRQGMDKSFDAGQTVGTKIDGTLNDDSDRDRGWVSEWIVPWKGIRGVSEPPTPGAEWRLNAFRIEKYRENGKTLGEYTAWSPPKVGDFHNVARFGRMRFGP